MAKALIGLCDCPECGHHDAEISETKAGLAMRFCPQCKAQYFPKKTPSSDLLIAKARPNTATGRHAPPVREPEPKREWHPIPEKGNPVEITSGPLAPVQQPKPQPAKKPEATIF